MERYQAVRLAEDVVAYGARIRVLPTADLPAKELVLLQVMKGLVQRFLVTLDELGPDGEPVRENADFAAFSARGSLVAETGSTGVERLRDGLPVASVRTEEPIAFIEGSSILSGLIAARRTRRASATSCSSTRRSWSRWWIARSWLSRWRTGASRSRTAAGSASSDSARGCASSSARARRTGAGSTSCPRRETPEQAKAVVSSMRLDPARIFRGDPANWNKASSAEASAGTGEKGAEGDR